jgi:hypothetical protein
MGRYTVQMTFETPDQRSPLTLTKRLPGSASSMRLLGADGLLAVSASRVSAESPAEAAMIVVQAVHARWSKSRGQLKMRSWTAHRERVLFGVRGRRDSSRGGPWGWDDGDEGGSAGVREPRRPLPGPGSLHVARDLP